MSREKDGQTANDDAQAAASNVIAAQTGIRIAHQRMGLNTGGTGGGFGGGGLGGGFVGGGGRTAFEQEKATSAANCRPAARGGKSPYDCACHHEEDGHDGGLCTE